MPRGWSRCGGKPCSPKRCSRARPRDTGTILNCTASARSRRLSAIAAYLRAVHAEAATRGYRFDAGKISAGRTAPRIAVTRGQLEFERRHLMAKLEARAPERWRTMSASDAVEPHPLFRMVPGEVADWERP